MSVELYKQQILNINKTLNKKLWYGGRLIEIHSDHKRKFEDERKQVVNKLLLLTDNMSKEDKSCVFDWILNNSY